MQVPCRGKGQSPQPADVNRAVFELWNFRMWFPDRYALVHCTHGYNRTGEEERDGAEMGRRGRGKGGLPYYMVLHVTTVTTGRVRVGSRVGNERRGRGRGCVLAELVCADP